MTISLNLPEELEQRLLAEVRAGRHASLEEAILERLSQREQPDLLAATGLDAQGLRRDLDDAWNNRGDAVDGQAVFARLRAKSAADKSQDK